MHTGWFSWIFHNFHYFFCRYTERYISPGTYTCCIIGHLTQIRKERWISWCITPHPQSILVWKSMYLTKLCGNEFKNYSYFTLFKWNWRGSFLKNPPDGAEHSLKCIESRNRCHFHFKKLFKTVNFAFMWKNYLLVKKHRKVSFVIFLRRFTSSNFPLFELEHTRAGKNLMT